MITLSAEHLAARAVAALAATLTRLNAGATGATLTLYDSIHPAIGADAGGTPLAVFTLPKPAGTIEAGVLTLAAADDALILKTGIAVWARCATTVGVEFDCDVTDTEGTGTVKLATTQLYAGGSVRLASGTLG